MVVVAYKVEIRLARVSSLVVSGDNYLYYNLVS